MIDINDSLARSTSGRWLYVQSLIRTKKTLKMRLCLCEQVTYNVDFSGHSRIDGVILAEYEKSSKKSTKLIEIMHKPVALV